MKPLGAPAALRAACIDWAPILATAAIVVIAALYAWETARADRRLERLHVNSTAALSDLRERVAADIDPEDQHL